MRFRTRKHFALLVRLALEPGKRFTRDYLTDLLWPGAAGPRANHSLAQGLSVIKAKVAREAVLIQRATVGLAPGWVDVDALHLGNGDVCVDGPFLDGFEIPAARSFEDWKDECRARLLPQLRDCLVRQMDAARRIGDFATVERRAERLQELDPTAEEAIRGIMEARAWAGDRSNALKAFARYETQLAEELGAKPGADLVRMADLLRDGRRSSPRPVTSGVAPGSEVVARRFEPETLIGREREFSVLYDAWIEARRRNPRFVVVTSDPGVGKTTLANAFVSSCQMEGAVVARAQAYDAERELPFAVLGELVKQLASQRAIGGADPEALSELTRITTEIVRVFPGVPKPVEWSPEVTPMRLADAFLKTVTAAAEDSPIVIVVDDIHAADNASTAILHVVARKLTDVRVLVILTGRTSELRLSGAPAAFTSDNAIEGLRTLEVDVLPTEAAERVVAKVAAAAEQADPPTDRILRVSGGNPLALELLTREWAAHGPASLLRDLEALDTQPVPSLGIPRAIAAVFERQSRRLDAATRAALDLAAVLGRRLTDLRLYDAVDLTPSQAAVGLSRLKDEGLLREVRGDLEFRNELIRAQAYYAVAGPARQHLHRRVAELLGATPEPHENEAISLEIAWHFLRGGDATSAEPHAVAGAEHALQGGAPVEAERVLKRLTAEDHHSRTDAKVPRLLAKALVSQSKGEAAAPILTSILEDAALPGRDRAEVLCLRAASEYLRREDGSRYGECATEALDAALDVGAPELIAQAVFEYARSGVTKGDGGRVREAASRIGRVLEQPDVQNNALMFFARSYCRFFCCEAFGAVEDSEAALRLHQGSTNLVERSFLLNGHAVCLRGVGRTVESKEAFERALDLSLQVGDDSRASIICTNLAMLENSRGHFEVGLTYGQKALGFARTDVNQPLRTLVYLVLMESCALLGRMVEAQEWMDAARAALCGNPTMLNRIEFYLEAAGFGLIQGNVSLAVSLIEDAERATQGQELILYDVGVFERYRAFRAAHTEGLEVAWALIQAAAQRFRGSHPLYYVNILPAKAWLEHKMHGSYSRETEDGLKLLTEFDLEGKRAIWIAQGFLT